METMSVKATGMRLKIASKIAVLRDTYYVLLSRLFSPQATPPLAHAPATATAPTAKEKEAKESKDRSRGTAGIGGVPHEYVCPITMEVMNDPVIASNGLFTRGLLSGGGWQHTTRLR